MRLSFELLGRHRLSPGKDPISSSDCSARRYLHKILEHCGADRDAKVVNKASVKARCCLDLAPISCNLAAISWPSVGQGVQVAWKITSLLTATSLPL